MENGNGKRRIWEFKSYTINRILGLCFDESGLKSLFKELKLNYTPQGSALPEMYQQLAQICRTQSSHAKRVEKILEKQFAPHKKDLATLDLQKLYAFLAGENRTAFKGIPIAAIIWFGARNGDTNRDKDGNFNESGELETTISMTLQLREYQALRFHDELIQNLPESIDKAEDIIKVLNDARDSNVKLQRRCERLEQKKEELISERETIKSDKIGLVHDLDDQKRLNDQLVRRVEGLGGETTFEDLNAMKTEIEFFREEIKRLNKENTGLMKLYVSESDYMLSGRANTGMEAQLACSGRNCNPLEVETQLNDVSVAYVGGVESLESSYKDMAQSFGCPFCYHGGHCERGKREIEGIVERNDVIFCPVDINSHNACRMVKEACKLRNKSCYFLRSSGLSAFKKSLMTLAVEG